MRSMCWARPARKDVALILEGEFSEYMVVCLRLVVVAVVVMKIIGILDLLPPERDRGANTLSFR